MDRTMIAAVALAAAAGALAACNTMSGAGQDIQQGGAALTGSADQNGATVQPAPATNPPPPGQSTAPRPSQY